MKYTYLAIILAFAGCTKMCGVTRGDLSPEQVVEAYLDIALNMSNVDQRDLLLTYTTGNLKDSIRKASKETIQRAYVDREYEIQSYSVVERRDRTPRETEITFQLTYLDMGEEKTDKANAPVVTTENTVSALKKDSVWYIQDVLGNKTSIDFPVSAAAVISAKP